MSWFCQVGRPLFKGPITCLNGCIMEIFLRIPKGWSKPIQNMGRETCDLDGARLWIGPGSEIYCDLEHDLETVAKLPKPAEKSSTIRY
jgi:hypothetical protein